MNRYRLGTVVVICIVLLSVSDTVHGGDAAVSFHINNCVDKLTFTGCKDVIGTFTTKPTPSIDQYSRGVMTMALPVSTQTVQANCTYEYENKDGKWTAFFDWQWAFFGDQDAGAGTIDTKDDERTAISLTVGTIFDQITCFWLYYGGTQMDCVYRTNDTSGCKPADEHSSFVRITRPQ